MTGHDDVTRVAWAEARRRARAEASGATSELVSLQDAIGRVLSSDIVAVQPIPHFTSSAMDGWAVVGEGPWVLGERDALSPGSAWPVVTGQQLPTGVRGVLRSETGTVLDGMLSPSGGDEPAPGKHVRQIGTEAAAGDAVVRAGCVINPAHVALAAACALDELQVVTRPGVGILFTGDEVIESGVPLPGQVRDSFGPQLSAVVTMLGGAVVSTARIGDDVDATVRAIAGQAAGASVVITTGGTGHSPADQLRAALQRLGATVLVGSIALRPGGPTMLARLPGGQFVVCLPGNPLAALMGLFTVGAPLLAALGGRPSEASATVNLAVDMPGAPGATQLLPYVLDSGRAAPTAWTGSAMMRGLAMADGILVVPLGGAVSGSAVEALPLPW